MVCTERDAHERIPSQDGADSAFNRAEASPAPLPVVGGLAERTVGGGGVTRIGEAAESLVKMINVRVPDGLGGSRKAAISLNGRHFHVTVPAHLSPGDTFSVSIDNGLKATHAYASTKSVPGGSSNEVDGRGQGA